MSSNEKLPTLREQRIKERQDKVARLLARHMPIREIAAALGVSDRTIKYDVKAIRQQAARDLANTSDVLSVAAGVDMRAERRLRDLSILFMQADEQNENGIHTLGLADRIQLKLNILKELERQDTSRLVALQKLGVVQQAPKEVVFDIKAAKMLGGIPHQQLQKALELDTAGFMEEMARALGAEALAELMEGDVTEFQSDRLLGDGGSSGDPD